MYSSLYFATNNELCVVKEDNLKKIIRNKIAIAPKFKIWDK